jgi:osmotically-inducible protein OsmY
MDNLATSTDIKARIFSDPSITSAQVEAEANNGIVALSGTVGSPEELNRIHEIVQNTPNVRELGSTISVQSDWALTQGRYLK